MKKLLTCFLCIGFAVYSYAQGPATPAEEDVVYFKDGGVLRGEIVGNTKTSGRIQLRDGSIFVYRKKNIKMASKEPVSEDSNAKEDSLKMVMITKKVIEEENQKRKQEEEIAALQKMIDANRKDGDKKEEKKDKEGGGFRMYSALEVLGGIGTETLPAVDSAPALANKQRIVGMHYAIGGRTDYFFIGLNVGLHQIHRNLSPMAAAMQDTLPTTLLALPVGLDMRIEFVPQAGMSPYLGISGAYALSLTEGVNSYMVVNPSFGLRFGRNRISSLISGGYQLNIDGGNITHYITLRLGLVF